MDNSIETKFKEFLHLYWIRPENALLSIFKSKALENISFDSPSLDLSCGDGLFMGIHLGGKINDEFDYFEFTDAKNFQHSSFIDIYDSLEKEYDIDFKKTATMIDFGLDWKQNLLDKASKLKIYKKLILHDNNNIPLPFDDNFFMTIFSNSIYWIKNVEELLVDLHRILHYDGTLILQIATPEHFTTLKKLEQFMDSESINIIDRNRTQTNLGLKTYSEWVDLFQKTKFKVIDVKQVYPNKRIIDFWNIGLRPIAHLLIQIFSNLNNNEKQKIRNEWINIFFTLLKPLLHFNEQQKIEDSPYLQFILKK